MPFRRTLLIACLLPAALLLGPPAAGALANGTSVSHRDAKAQAQARELARRVEACVAYSKDYTQCETAGELHAGRLPYGFGRGQVSVTSATVSSYTVTAISRSGNSFLITRSATGQVKHTCTSAGKGRCRRSGRW